MRSVVLALVVLAVAAPPAAAAPALTFELADTDVQFGRAHSVSGVLADGTTPMPGQPVVLEGQRRFVGAWRRLATTVTDASGAYAFEPVLDRNYRLRAVVQPLHVSSRVVRAYTLPAFRLMFQALKPRVVRLIQRYAVPRDVRLSTPTIFYLGPRKARFSTLRVKGKTRRLRAGRYRARVSVTLPASWKGRFRFGSCFHTSPGTGMGRPNARCAKRLRF